MVKARKATAASDFVTRLFKTKNHWAVWLDKNHRKNSGLWLQLAKKDSGLKSVTYQEAVEVALCYGWIDGQKRPQDERIWLQRFVPRSEKSMWSKINREKAKALIAGGHMKGAGLEAIECAKENGRWESAYDSPNKSTVPDDLQTALDASPRAKAFFDTLDRANRYAVLWRIQTAKKAEIRARNIRLFIEMLEQKKKLHP